MSAPRVFVILRPTDPVQFWSGLRYVRDVAHAERYASAEKATRAAEPLRDPRRGSDAWVCEVVDV